MTSQPTIDQLTSLAEAVVLDGFEAHGPALADLVTTARRLGVRPIAAGVLADRSAPCLVRERALGLVVVALAGVVGAPSAMVTTGAASAA